MLGFYEVGYYLGKLYVSQKITSVPQKQFSKTWFEFDWIPQVEFIHTAASQYWETCDIRNIWEIFDTLMENCNSFDIFWTRAEIIRKLLPEKFSSNFQHHLLLHKDTKMHVTCITLQ